MRVRVLYFSSAADLVQTSGEDFLLADSCDVAGLWAAMLGRHPRLRGLRASCRVARNREFVADETAALAEGDELAIMPPFSGG